MILEQHFKVGGFVTSYQRKKYPMDVVHVIGELRKDAAIDRIFSYLNLYDRLQFSEVEEVFIQQFPEHNIDCYTSIETAYVRECQWFNGIHIRAHIVTVQEIIEVSRTINNDGDGVRALTLRSSTACM